MLALCHPLARHPRGRPPQRLPPSIQPSSHARAPALLGSCPLGVTGAVVTPRLPLPIVPSAPVGSARWSSGGSLSLFPMHSRPLAQPEHSLVRVVSSARLERQRLPARAWRPGGP